MKVAKLNYYHLQTLAWEASIAHHYVISGCSQYFEVLSSRSVQLLLKNTNIGALVLASRLVEEYEKHRLDRARNLHDWCQPGWPIKSTTWKHGDCFIQ